MTERNQIFKCEICGNIVEVLRGGAGELFCCGAAMKIFAENSVDAVSEKHLPVAIKTARGAKIKIGETAHPMENSHFIEWIEVATADDRNFKKFLKPGEAPTAEFCGDEKIISSRAFCNLHGIWKIEI